MGSDSTNNRIDFIEHTHTYLIDGIIVPSVTQLMKGMSEQTYANIPPHILEAAAERGTVVHRAIYELETKGTIGEFFVEYQYLQTYLRLKALTHFKPVRQEFMLASVSGRWFAGTIDCVATIGDKTVLIDWKTGSSVHKDMWAVQLAGYDQLCRENGIHIDEHYIGHLYGKGKMYRIEPDHKAWHELTKE